MPVVPAFTVEVTCRDPHDVAVRHRVEVGGDGTVAVPDHRSGWGEADFVHAHLSSGEGPLQPCLWWAGALGGWSGATRWEGPTLDFGEGRLIDFRDWVFAQVPGPLPPAAANRFRERMGLFTFSSGPEEMSLHALHSMMTDLGMLTESGHTSGLRPNDTLTESLLLEALQYREDVLALAHENVPWKQAVGLLSCGLTAEESRAVYFAVTADPDYQRDPWFAGSVADVVDEALRVGVSRVRLVRFLERRVGAGPMRYAKFVDGQVREKVKGTPGDRDPWLTEVVACFPSLRVCASHYFGGRVDVVRQVDSWATLESAFIDLFIETAVTRLKDGVDPLTWPVGWMFPPYDAVLERFRVLQLPKDVTP